MENESVLEELFGLLIREEIPTEVRAAIARHFGEQHYLLAKEAVIAGLSDKDPMVRDASIDALANYWELHEVGPKLIEMVENDPQDFVRMRAAQGLGTIRYTEGLPTLKRVILESSDDEALQETAYEAVLSILGKDEYDILEGGVDKPTVIDWELVHTL
jgi:HEAT repeat protein